MDGATVLPNSTYARFILAQDKLKKIEGAIEIEENTIKINTKKLEKVLDVDNATFVFVM